MFEIKRNPQNIPAMPGKSVHELHVKSGPHIRGQARDRCTSQPRIVQEHSPLESPIQTGRKEARFQSTAI